METFWDTLYNYVNLCEYRNVKVPLQTKCLYISNRLAKIDCHINVLKFHPIPLLCLALILEESVLFFLCVSYRTDLHHTLRYRSE